MVSVERGKANLKGEGPFCVLGIENAYLVIGRNRHLWPHRDRVWKSLLRYVCTSSAIDRSCIVIASVLLMLGGGEEDEGIAQIFETRSPDRWTTVWLRTTINWRNGV